MVRIELERLAVQPLGFLERLRGVAQTAKIDPCGDMRGLGRRARGDRRLQRRRWRRSARSRARHGTDRRHSRRYATLAAPCRARAARPFRRARGSRNRARAGRTPAPSCCCCRARSRDRRRFERGRPIVAGRSAVASRARAAFSRYGAPRRSRRRALWPCAAVRGPGTRTRRGPCRRGPASRCRNARARAHEWARVPSKSATSRVEYAFIWRLLGARVFALGLWRVSFPRAAQTARASCRPRDWP